MIECSSFMEKGRSGQKGYSWKKRDQENADALQGMQAQLAKKQYCFMSHKKPNIRPTSGRCQKGQLMMPGIGLLSPGFTKILLKRD